MAITVGNANPGRISSVSVANPGRISSVGNATPGRIASVGNANPGVISSVGNANSWRAPLVYKPVVSPYSPPAPTGPPAPVYAPKLDFASINAQARSAAEGAVNPYYTKVLNEFLTQQAAQRQNQQTQYETDVKTIEENLKNTLEQNALTKTRTGEDVATNIGEIAQTADEFQTDSGQAFDANRLEEARGASTGGLGQQKLQASTAERNKTENRQVQKFAEATKQQELFKGRTFDDLLKSDELAGKGAEKGKTQKKFDLDTYIQGSQFNEQNKRNELERSRLQDIAANEAAQRKLAFQKYLAGITNPAQYEAAVRTYGGAF